MLTDYVFKIRNKIIEKSTPMLAKVNRRRIKNHDFIIISNNCWGGHVYRYFGLPYQSPAIGLCFFADEYIKFVCNLQHYLSCDLEIIDAKDSIYCEKMKQKKK